MSGPRTNSQVAFRLARLRDARKIAHMSRRLIEAGLPWSWRPERVAKHIRHRDSVVLAAWDHGELAGFAIMRYAETTAHLHLLAVEREYQQLGVGRRLVQWLEASAVTAGTFLISLEVRAENLAARSFYRRLGYKEVRCLVGYYSRVENAVRMVRDLRVKDAMR